MIQRSSILLEILIMLGCIGHSGVTAGSNPEDAAPA